MTDPDRQARLRQWARKLGRLRLDAEPLAEQLDRHRRVTWMLTAVPGVLGLAFVSLFSAFGHPGVGLAVVGVLLLPWVAIAWLDDALLRARASRFLTEFPEFANDQRPADPGGVPGADRPSS